MSRQKYFLPKLFVPFFLFLSQQPLFGAEPNGAVQAETSESAASSLSALQNAAEEGDPVAQWKLGRIYAVTLPHGPNPV